MSTARVVGVEIESDEVIGAGGFLCIRRLRMRNRREDGTLSAQYLVDFLERKKGVDAVVVAVWRRVGASGVEVLLRDGLRPPLYVGRPAQRLVLPDAKRYLFFREVIAGIVEDGDRAHGVMGLQARAAAEVEEEAGIVVAAERIELLGAGVFPSPGAMAERFFLAAVEVAADVEQRRPEGDGSPMEEGAGLQWMGLDDAIAACVAGEIEDAKTELTLRRLRDRLAMTQS